LFSWVIKGVLRRQYIGLDFDHEKDEEEEVWRGSGNVGEERARAEGVVGV